MLHAEVLSWGQHRAARSQLEVGKVSRLRENQDAIVGAVDSGVCDADQGVDGKCGLGGGRKNHVDI